MLKTLSLLVILLQPRYCSTASLNSTVAALHNSLCKSTAMCTSDIAWRPSLDWDAARLCRAPLLQLETDAFFESHYLEPIEFVDRWATPQTSYTQRITPAMYTGGMHHA